MAPKDTPNDPLTKRQMRFVDAIAQDDDRSGTKCAVDSGYAKSSAAEMASANLRNPCIVRAITDRKAQLAAMAGVDAALVVRELLYVATADPRELIHTRIGCCRHCWGIDHKREWAEHEYATALNDALQSMGLPPDFEGGLGYTPTREPNPDCLKCKGEGIPRTWLADSRKLSPQAARLLAGVKQTKDGIEVKMRDQNAALMALGRYLGMFTDKTELSGPGGGVIPLGVARLEDLTDEQLMAIAAGGLAEMKSGALEVRALSAGGEFDADKQREGIAIARQKNTYKGRVKVLDAGKVVAVKERIAAGVSKAKVAREFGISRPTLYAYLANTS